MKKTDKTFVFYSFNSLNFISIYDTYLKKNSSKQIFFLVMDKRNGSINCSLQSTFNERKLYFDLTQK